MISKILPLQKNKTNRSSHPRCSVRKGVLRDFAKFTGKHQCQSLFFKKEALPQVFLCKFCEISKDAFFAEPPDDCFLRARDIIIIYSANNEQT